MIRAYSRSSYGVTIHRKQTLKTLVLFFLLAFILVSTVLLISLQKSRSSKDQKDLVRLWQNDQYREIFDLSGKELEKKPLDYFLLSMRGFSAYQLAAAQINSQEMMFFLDECIWSLRKALSNKDHSRDGRIFYMLGKAYYGKGADYSELAIQYLEDAQRNGVTAGDMPEYLGLAYASVQDYQKSVAAFSQALVPEEDYKEGENNPNDVLLLAIAKSYFELEDYDTSGAYLTHCIEISKDFDTITQAKLILGNVMLKKGNLNEAEKLVMSVLTEGGEQAEARFLLGEIYTERGESTRARAEYRRASRIDPKYVLK
ncbi:MAG: tetratricopeptide repeat protein [Spirochaetaceae bacterium]|nr:tetratricopeptide repeat protein [Spirochaetaceae bacterium]